MINLISFTFKENNSKKDERRTQFIKYIINLYKI